MALARTIGYVIIAVVLLVVLLIWLRRRKVSLAKAEKQIASTEKVIEEKEHELLRFQKRKLGIIRDMLPNVGYRKFDDVVRSAKDFEDALEEQLKLVANLRSVDKRDIGYLLHLDIDLSDRGGEKISMSHVVKKLESSWGKIDSSMKEKKRRELESDPDPIRRGVMLLALTLVDIEDHLLSLKGVIDKQLKLIKQVKQGAENLKKGKMKGGEDFTSAIQNMANMIVYLRSSTAGEEQSETDMIERDSKSLQRYTDQLEQTEAANIKGPFLKVEGDAVEVVTDNKTRATRKYGRGERIDMGLLPSRLSIGSDPHHCIIVLSHDSPPLQAELTVHRKSRMASVMAAAGTTGTFIVSGRGVDVLYTSDADKQHLLARMQSDKRFEKIPGVKRKKSVKQLANAFVRGARNLKPGNHLMFAFGYDFELQA